MNRISKGREFGEERIDSNEIFSFHLVKPGLSKVPGFFREPARLRNFPGLLHREKFLTMNLGDPILRGSRYNFTKVAFFAWWAEETALDEYLRQASWARSENAWHVRMKLYRRWGEITELMDAVVAPHLAVPHGPVVAVTLARLNLRETLRFVKWGRPVESQVRDHAGQSLAVAGIRPLRTFSTFSLWRNEAEMLNMVAGRDRQRDGESHKLAMQERIRRDFHHEFCTMRFTPIKEMGSWEGRSKILDGFRIR